VSNLKDQYNEPLCIPVEQVYTGRYFLHRLQTYQRCMPDEEQYHPAYKEPGVLAYHWPEHGHKVPVRFRADTPVYPARNVGGTFTIIHRRRKR
jgi:hypothetical protein